MQLLAVSILYFTKFPEKDIVMLWGSVFLFSSNILYVNFY
jgi:hypothetical protein